MCVFAFEKSRESPGRKLFKLSWNPLETGILPTALSPPWREPRGPSEGQIEGTRFICPGERSPFAYRNRA
ncbi:hypothetical protein L596_008249 [Steinernema carpocapsae]|uniref:Uncharacterized protein n=1 Tax=Steinernema carpocapsae TaxID=34508 RepID=A0A4V6A6C0_STECR|nr:hypothetical protein L596_008249 [Steinernema carpocapsae]